MSTKAGPLLPPSTAGMVGTQGTLGLTPVKGGNERPDFRKPWLTSQASFLIRIHVSTDKELCLHFDASQP